VNWRSRWTFWGVVFIVLALVSVPSVELISAATDYVRFITGWEPLPLKPTPTTFTPRDRRAADASFPELSPVEFKFKAPKAKSVELVGDFNAWKPGLLKMIRNGKTWYVVVPLPPGRHKYLFLADGEPKVDPSADTGDGPEGRRVSIRNVK
jgi:hypothetical protein